MIEQLDAAFVALNFNGIGGQQISDQHADKLLKAYQKQ